MIRIGLGNTAEVFEYSEGKVCKLFFEGYPLNYVKLEYNNAKTLFKLNLNVPQPFEIINSANRNGIIYENIKGKTLWDSIDSNELNEINILKLFVAQHKRLLSIHSSELISYKDFLTTMISKNPTATPQLKKEISNLPDGDTILHGDFHPGNLIINPTGEIIIIDFMNVCRGPALYDIARTYYLLTTVNPPFAEAYLNAMTTSKESIQPYLNIIKACRKYEG